jgi:glycine betaine/proline transport system ATP-binding protein
MAILRVKNLSKVFGSHPERALEHIEQGKNREDTRDATGQVIGVADVTFEVERGEILVVMGLSGSGKSTLVRCINRLIEPTAGEVWIEDDEVTAMSRRELRELRRHKLGMVFQNFGLMPHRTVLENASYGLEVMGEPADQRREEAAKALELVGLDGWENEYPTQLSGGMQQRVGLARALATDPEIILMDEALSALDPLIRKDMQNELIDLQRKLEKTIVFITHDLDEAINMGDRIVLMKDGYVVQTGTAEEILTNPANDYVERFVEEVDVSKVLTAEAVMKPVRTVAHPSDGPRTVLHKMKDEGLSTMFVADAHGVFQGLVRAEKAAELAKHDGDTPASEDQKKELIEKTDRCVPVDTPLSEIMPLMTATRDPIAVVDEEKRLRGVVVIGALLAGVCEGAPQNDQAQQRGT